MATPTAQCQRHDGSAPLQVINCVDEQGLLTVATRSQNGDLILQRYNPIEAQRQSRQVGYFQGHIIALKITVYRPLGGGSITFLIVCPTYRETLFMFSPILIA